MIGRNKRYIFSSDFIENRDVSPGIRISAVTTLKDFKDFFQVPWLIYRNDTNWVAPFWIELRDFFKKKNPFWIHADAQLFVAYHNSTIVGRTKSRKVGDTQYYYLYTDELKSETFTPFV